MMMMMMMMMMTMSSSFSLTQNATFSTRREETVKVVVCHVVDDDFCVFDDDFWQHLSSRVLRDTRARSLSHVSFLSSKDREKSDTKKLFSFNFKKALFCARCHFHSSPPKNVSKKTQKL